jgi:hypothetical protein
MARQKTTLPGAEKSFRPEIRTPRTDKAANPIRREQPPRTRHRPILGGGPVSKRIPPKESQYTELTRERAEKLATLRRGRFDEFTWAAIGGLAASLPSTAHSYTEVRTLAVFSLSLPQAVDFGVTLVFLTMVIVALVSRKRGMTSMQYLERHFGPDPDAPPRKVWFMRRAEIGHHHHIAGAYLLRYAQEASWREDNRRKSNGEQVNRLTGLAMKQKPSVDFSGYWQRHQSQAAAQT